MEKIYIIQKPKKKKISEVAALMVSLDALDEQQKIIRQANNEYLSWDEFRRKSWSTEKREDIWALVKFYRQAAASPTPIQDKSEETYHYDPQRHAEFTHMIDIEYGGNLLGVKDFSEGDKRQIIRRNLIEESIASSKLEGANISRETARRMLAEGRNPRDRSEQMIVNNHATMSWIEETGKNKKLTRDMIYELHRKVISGTLVDESQEGKLRETFDSKGKRLVIKPWDQETVAYVTPDREFVDAQLPRLVRFANDEDGSPFIHPLKKAIMLHFWIGLLHPFEDGNGRLARILFYWYMLRKDYWAFSYLSLSERILKSPKQYAMAFINSEQDDFDLNYFIQYNIEKLILARRNLQSYLLEKIAENRRGNQLEGGRHGLNKRQIRALQYLHHGEINQITVTGHHNNNPDIGYVTAVSDLKSLVTKGFLKKHKSGRNVFYQPTDKLQLLFK